MSYVEPGPLGTYSDAARRASDGVRLHIIALHAHLSTERWCAIRLSDGHVSEHTFATKRLCIGKHEHDNRRCVNEEQCAYLYIPMDDFNPRAAEKYLKFTRQLYDAGMRIIDPDREIVMPMRGMGVFTPIKSQRPAGLHVPGRTQRRIIHP